MYVMYVMYVIHCKGNLQIDCYKNLNDVVGELLLDAKSIF